MTKRDTGKQAAAALSPYLSLRESVRPAIFAYNLLEREQGRAGVLTQEINTLLKATEDLLESAGLFHMLSPGPLGDADPVPDDSSHQARLVEAYSQAGMKWARIVGSCLNLADALLAEALWDDAQRLADYVEAAGESGAAADITARTNTAQRKAAVEAEAARRKAAAEAEEARRKAAAEAFLARYTDFLPHLSDAMPPEYIQEAISLFREAGDYPATAPNIRQKMRAPLIGSLASYLHSKFESLNPSITISDYVNSYQQYTANLAGWERLFVAFEKDWTGI